MTFSPAVCERSGGLIGRTSWQTVWAQTLVAVFVISSWERYLTPTIPLSTRGCNSLQYVPQLVSYNTIQYLSQLEVAMLYNTSLNSKLQYLKIPLSIQSYYALQCLSQLEVTIPYNTGACLACSSLLLSLCFLVVCPDKKENVFHSDESGEGE